MKILCAPLAHEEAHLQKSMYEAVFAVNVLSSAVVAGMVRLGKALRKVEPSDR